MVPWLGPRCSHSCSLGSCTEVQACGSRTHRAGSVWDQPKSEVSLREAVAEASSQLQKPGLRSSCERCCPAVTDALALPTQVANPPQAAFGAGQGEGLLGPHPGRGTSPEKLGCDKSRLKPSPAFVQACEMKTQKGWDQTELFALRSSSSARGRPPSWLPGDGRRRLRAPGGL